MWRDIQWKKETTGGITADAKKAIKKRKMFACKSKQLFPTGCKVHHIKYGNGTVKKISDGKIIVEFGKLRYSALKKLMRKRSGYADYNPPWLKIDGLNCGKVDMGNTAIEI